MRIAGKRNSHMVLTLAAALAATIAAPRALAADGTLLTLEDDWRRAATLVVQDQARSQGIIVPGEQAVFALVPDGGGTVGAAPASGGSHVLFVSRQAHRLQAGLYQAVVDSAGRARLFYLDPERGRVLTGFRVPPGNPAAFHTPFGDDMCRNAPDLIMEFCQTFVACAAYGFFC